MTEAMHLIRTELGEDAVILHSKRIDTGGIFGLFKKQQIQVIAAVDQLEELPKRRNTVKTTQAKVVNQAPSDNQLTLTNEIEQLKSLIREMQPRKTVDELNYPQPFQSFDDHFRQHGVIEGARLVIVKQLMKNWYGAERDQIEINSAQINVAEVFQSLFSDLSFGQALQKKVVNVVGPTGVGKTTTIAKLAAIATLQQKRKVAFITTDTFRISAVDQLKTYAKILNIPVKVAYSIDDFKNAISQFSHYDLILVDSAGRNFRNALYVKELAKVIDFEQDTETHLVLSLTSKYEDMKEIIEQFKHLTIQSIIVTKHDETSTYGALVNIPFEYNLPISYVTTGQNVPDDITIASIEYISSIMNEVNIDE